jgi:folate-binding protein YgfZ
VEARLAGLEDKLARVSPIIWDWLDIRAGEARVTQAVVEQFVPQMVNYDVIGAVNFRKGCYPGQEVVARSQYRGTIKRRTVLAHIGPAADRSADPAAEHGADPAAHIAAGRELYHSADPAQPCGMIVNAAPAPHGGYDVLVEIKLAALDEGTVHLGSIDGAPLAFEALPYALPADS